MLKKSIVLIVLGLSFQGIAQIVCKTSFESWNDEYEYLQSSWTTDGFSAKCVSSPKNRTV